MYLIFICSSRYIWFTYSYNCKQISFMLQQPENKVTKEDEYKWSALKLIRSKIKKYCIISKGKKHYLQKCIFVVQQIFMTYDSKVLVNFIPIYRNMLFFCSKIIEFDTNRKYVCLNNDIRLFRNLDIIFWYS